MEKDRQFPWVEYLPEARLYRIYTEDSSHTDVDTEEAVESFLSGYRQIKDEYDGFLSDSEADADVLKSAGWGTDEDYTGGCQDEMEL